MTDPNEKIEKQPERTENEVRESQTDEHAETNWTENQQIDEEGNEVHTFSNLC